ncbi:hypothetical protein SS50377_25506 [Spironucleus salmonicida]|uniref:Uncharacterized protein n=1 Tax=Spironucleus salmonicida TaxID=348837 RepID=V6LL12_9EUKA|nr:hypothetical protein SS50377_25506 [Spironucleus salmonicida]|eukprot:EST45053.1 Hypothetical protein SS50377_15073 [Spironucleus salmonicida]
MLFSYKNQILIVCEFQFQIDKHKLIKINQQKLITIETFSQISYSSTNDTVIIPGNQILQNIVVQTDEFQLLFKRGSNIIFVNLNNTEQLDFDEKIILDNPIYQVEVLRSCSGVILLVLTKVVNYQNIMFSETMDVCVNIIQFNSQDYFKYKNLGFHEYKTAFEESRVFDSIQKDYLGDFEKKIQNIMKLKDQLNINQLSFQCNQFVLLSNDQLSNIIEKELKSDKPDIYKIRQCQKLINKD